MSPASASAKSAPAPTSPAIKTTARKDGDDYVINGGKMWTTNGTQADFLCLLANTGEGPAARTRR
jgi:citronellyl-CoA dehydrogenase